MKINVLGTDYEIVFSSGKDDELINDSCDGYCDKSAKKIVVTTDNEDLSDFVFYQKKILRHEIIHAFMYESGLDCNWHHADEWGHDETQVDWFAIQAPKLFEAFKLADAL